MDCVLHIEGALGIDHADVPLTSKQVTEVVGPNASGKTSIAVAAQAVFARNANPLRLPATLAKWYLFDQTGDGSVRFDDEGVETVWWPATQKITGPAEKDPVSSEAAVGLVDFVSRTGTKERLVALQDALLPDDEIVIQKVTGRLGEYLPASDVKGAVHHVRERGWDATQAVYADRARVTKREWSAITNVYYGVRVAADWRPDGWIADMDGMTVGRAEAAVTDVRDALEALHRVQAVSEQDRERAEAARDALPELKRRATECDDKVRRIDSERAGLPLGEASRAVQTARAAVKAADAEVRRYKKTEKHQRCPHCDRALTIRPGGEIVAFDAEVLEQLTAAAAERKRDAAAVAAGLEARLDDLDSEHNLLTDERRRALAVHFAAQKAADDAQGKAALADHPLADDMRAAALSEAEQAVEDARDVVKMVKAQREAAGLHETIVRYAAIATQLGPKGVRARMIDEGRRKLRGGLVALSRTTGWAIVEVDESGTVVYDGLPVPMCSESERWRAQACIQLTLAAITGAQVVVLDRADLLDAATRASLFRGLRRVTAATGMAVLVCSTGEPLAEKPEWGRQVVVEEGVTA